MRVDKKKFDAIVIGIMRKHFSNETISKVMAEMGRKGGKIGGKVCLDSMTHEQRMQRAQKAAATRWAKYKEKLLLEKI